MEIGQRVIVQAIVHHVYVGDARTIERKLLPAPKTAFYVGYTFKQEGQIREPSPSPWDGSSGGQSYLEIKKTYKVLRVKFSARGNDKFAFAEDVHVIEKGGAS